MIDYETLKCSIHIDSVMSDESNDCAVRALTAVTGMKYAHINKWLINNKFRNPKSNTKNAGMFQFLHEHNVAYNYDSVTVPTIRSFQKQKLPGKFLVFVKNHVLAVIDGNAIDWADNRLHRIKCIVKILD